MVLNDWVDDVFMEIFGKLFGIPGGGGNLVRRRRADHVQDGQHSRQSSHSDKL